MKVSEFLMEAYQMKNKNPRMLYPFDIEKCKSCPYRDRCYKEGANYEK